MSSNVLAFSRGGPTSNHSMRASMTTCSVPASNPTRSDRKLSVKSISQVTSAERAPPGSTSSRPRRLHIGPPARLRRPPAQHEASRRDGRRSAPTSAFRRSRPERKDPSGGRCSAAERLVWQGGSPCVPSTSTENVLVAGPGDHRCRQAQRVGVQAPVIAQPSGSASGRRAS